MNSIHDSCELAAEQDRISYNQVVQSLKNTIIKPKNPIILVFLLSIQILIDQTEPRSKIICKLTMTINWNFRRQICPKLTYIQMQKIIS